MTDVVLSWDFTLSDRNGCAANHRRVHAADDRLAETHPTWIFRIPPAKRECARKTRAQLNEIAVSRRWTLGGLTQFRLGSRRRQAKLLYAKKIEERCRNGFDVCDNLIRTARKSLILKTERCWSGRSGTLGNRCRRRSLTHTDTHQRTRHQRLPATTVCVTMSPCSTLFDRGLRVHVTQS